MNFLIYYVLVKIDISLFLSAILGYAVGLVVSYFGNVIWVFEAIHRSWCMKTIMRFGLLYACSGVMMATIISVSVGIGINDARLGWLIGAIFAVTMNYMGQVYFVHRR